MMAHTTKITEQEMPAGKQADEVSSPTGEGWKDESICGILKAIQWPTPFVAARSAALSMAASAVIGGMLYLWGYVVNQVIAFVV